jgi:hypothetical protein
MSHFDFKKASQAKELPIEQQVVVDVIRGDQSFNRLVKECGKGKTVNDLVKQVLHAEGTDCPVKKVKDDGTVEYYSLSHVTSKKDGKLSDEGKAFYAWCELSDDDRAKADDTFFFVLTANSMKSSISRTFAVNKNKEFRFRKDGTPIRKVQGDKASGSDKTPTRKVDDIWKAFQESFDIDRAKLKPADLVIVRNFALRTLDKMNIDKNLPEVTGI